MKTKEIEIEVTEDDILGWLEGAIGDRLPTLNYDAWSVENIFSRDIQAPARRWAITLQARGGGGGEPMSGQPWTPTPGPWEVDSAGLVYDSRNNTVAHGRYSNYLPEPEQRANAQLIAAAPDLYKELEEIYEWTRHKDTEWAERARAALAKARGESP